MKAKNSQKKLVINKLTVSNLSHQEQNFIKAGEITITVSIVETCDQKPTQAHCNIQ